MSTTTTNAATATNAATDATANANATNAATNAATGLIRLHFQRLHPKQQGHRHFSYACRLSIGLPHAYAKADSQANPSSYTQTYAKANSQAHPTASTKVHVRLQDTQMQTRSAWWKQ
jgi:hypothetical protein